MFDWITGDDDQNWSYNALTQIWDDFPGGVAEGCTDSSCTDNHQEQEFDDGNDVHGRNVRDFEFHEDSFWEMSSTLAKIDPLSLVKTDPTM